MEDFRRQNIQQFADWAARNIQGDEKGEAQIFLDHLFRAFGQGGCLDVGGSPEFRLRKRQEDGGGVAFADYVWKPVVLIEMKKRGEDLARHYRQAFDYWTRLAPGRPRYVLLSNFDEFWIYDFDSAQLDTPVDTVTLAELPARYGPLAFLFPTNETPVFGNNHEAVTRHAADLLALCFNKLIARRVERPTAQRFILQMLVALFAEDIGLLEQDLVGRLLADCQRPSDSYDLLGGLFTAMNTPQRATGGRFRGVDYFNGGLFAAPARVELYPDELNQLREAAKADWSKVRPEIFGTLFEHSMDQAERHALGGHYTSPADIMKIVGPTLVEPWRERIESARTLDRLIALRERMRRYTVLDPACGSGNFLYLAYRELKRLEVRLNERITEKDPRHVAGQAGLGFVTARQFYGIDIVPFAVELAKVTMMIGRKLAIDELHVTEPALPLDNLDANFLVGDALLCGDERGMAVPTVRGAAIPAVRGAEHGIEGVPCPYPSAGKGMSSPAGEDPGHALPQTARKGMAPGEDAHATVRTPWPKTDVIIGNPPFLGAKRLKPERGADYVNRLRRAYPEVPGMADYCVYWFRRAADHLPACTAEDPLAGRAGLVGTQNIRNNQSRVGGLDHVVKTGTIIEAVDNQPWSGEANVHVSIVNWVKTKDAALLPAKRKLWVKSTQPSFKLKTLDKSINPAARSFELCGEEFPVISASLSGETDVSKARNLKCNQEPSVSFNGQMLGHRGFLLDHEQRESIVTKDKRSAEVIFPYLNGDEILSGLGKPDRFVLDFGQLSQLQAARYEAAFSWVKKTVLPDRQRKAEEGKDSEGNLRPHHKAFLARWWQLSFGRPELLALLAKIPRYLCCSLVTKRAIFSFVSSDVRPSNLLQVFALADDYSFGVMQSAVHWAWFKAKCSKLKTDFRFGEVVWNSFPWPQSPTRAQVEAVAEAGRAVRRIRAAALDGMKGGLRALYRTLELPGDNPLKDAHAALDSAVRRAYGFQEGKDLLSQLLLLNFVVAEGIEKGQAVTSPGVPPSYGDAKALITDDCIRP